MKENNIKQEYLNTENRPFAFNEVEWDNYLEETYFKD